MKSLVSKLDLIKFQDLAIYIWNNLYQKWGYFIWDQNFSEKGFFNPKHSYNLYKLKYYLPKYLLSNLNIFQSDFKIIL